MKKIYAIALSALLFTACSKDKEPTPESTDLGAQVAGTYQISKAEFGGVKVTLPSNGISMSVKLTRTSDTSAELLLTSTANGSNTSGGGSVTLTKSGSRIVIKDIVSEMGYVEGKMIHLKGKDASGIDYVAEGSK